MINCFSISSQRDFTRQEYYLHSSIKNSKLKSLATLHHLRHKEISIWLEVGHRQVTIKLKYKWVISGDYLHLTMPCCMYFTLPRVLIKVPHCQHLVNINIIIYAIITFQTLLTCSNLHRAWLSNYTKTLKRRKMVSCSYTIYKRDQVSKRFCTNVGPCPPLRRQNKSWTKRLVLISGGFCFPGLEIVLPQPITSSCMYSSTGGCLFRHRNAHCSMRMAHHFSKGTSGEKLKAVSLGWLLQCHWECCSGEERGWAHGEGIWEEISSWKGKG